MPLPCWHLPVPSPVHGADTCTLLAGALLTRRPVSAAAPAPRLAPPLRHALSACTAPSAARPAPAGTARHRRPSQV